MDKSRQGGLRILFADDEAHLRDLMQMELPRMGHEVTVCPDGTAALKALDTATSGSVGSGSGWGGAAGETAASVIPPPPR